MYPTVDELPDANMDFVIVMQIKIVVFALFSVHFFSKPSVIRKVKSNIL